MCFSIFKSIYLFLYEEKYLQVSTEPNKSVDICAVLDEITGL